MILNSFFVEIETSFHGIFSHSTFCFGFIMRYFAPSSTFWISVFFTVSTRYSFTFSVFHFCTDTRKLSISWSVIESSELSKNRVVKIRNPVMMIPSTMTANPGDTLSTTHERTSHVSDPIPKVILFLARIVPYSLGSARESTYPYVQTSLISFVRP